METMETENPWVNCFSTQLLEPVTEPTLRRCNVAHAPWLSAGAGANGGQKYRGTKADALFPKMPTFR